MSYRRLSPGPGVCGRFSRRREAASSRAASNAVILTPIRHQAEQPFPHATNGSATRPTSARNRYSFPSLALANAFATATSRSNPSSRKLSSVCVWPSHLDAGRIRLSDRCARCSGHSTRRSLGDCFRSRPPLTRRNRMAAPSLELTARHWHAHAQRGITVRGSPGSGGPRARTFRPSPCQQRASTHDCRRALDEIDRAARTRAAPVVNPGACGAPMVIA